MRQRQDEKSELTFEERVRFVMLGHQLAKDVRATWGGVPHDRIFTLLEYVDTGDGDGELRGVVETTAREYLKDALADLVDQDEQSVAEAVGYALVGWMAVATSEDDDEESLRMAICEYVNGTLSDDAEDERDGDDDDVEGVEHDGEVGQQE